MLISHIADVHFRGLSRHDEYRKVFESYAQQCKDLGVDHIFVGGDIFHTKTSGISPEYIDVLTWWLNLLGDTAKVHLILGNHDGNLSNSSRQDAISPVVNALNHPNVKLYKNSGVYPIEPGYNLCVFSLFDKENWEIVKPIEGEFNIACYHGSVKGAVTETDWSVEGEVDVEKFRSFDVCLLGDIHRAQVLDYKEINGKKIPWIAYPGSTIQQNYGESTEHFHILWTINSKDDFGLEFKKLENPKPFITIDWKGAVDLTLSDLDKHPNGSRFRIKTTDYISQKEIHELSKALKGQKLATEITFAATPQVQQQAKKTLAASGISLTKSDLRNADTIIKLMKGMHKNSDVSDESWTRLTEIVTNYLKNVSLVDDVPRNVKWSLRRIEFDNIFSYGEGNVISFENLEGIVGLFGRNRIGKSSIVGSVMYSLFNSTDRGSLKNLHVINIRKQHCYAKSVINVAGSDYIIERQSVKHESKKGLMTANTSLNLFKMQDGEAIDLVGEQRSDTEKVVRNLIGTVDDFLTTGASTQGDVNRFISDGSAQRKAFLSKLLDLDIFDDLLAQAKNDVNSLKAQLSTLPKDLGDDVVGDYENQIKELRSNIEKFNDELDESSKTIIEHQQKLSKIDQRTPVTDSQLAELKTSIQKVQMRMSSLEEAKESSGDRIERILELMKKNDVILKKNDVSKLQATLNSINEIEGQLKDVKRDLEVEERELKRHLKTVSTLDEVPCGSEYPTCKFIKDAHELSPIVPQQREKVKSLLKVVEKLELALTSQNKKEIVEKLSMITTAEKENQTLDSKLSTLRIEIANSDVELQKLSTSLDGLTSKYNDAAAVHNKQKNDEVNFLKGRIKDIQQRLKDIDAKKMECSSTIGVLTSKIEKHRSDIGLRSKLLSDLKLYELAQLSFSKKGLPSAITNDQLPVINAEIAQILGGIADFTTELVMEDDGSLEVYINYGDSKRLIELCSGMEKMISSLAIRTALIKASSLPKSDIFIIDEGFGVLDESSIDSCVKLLRALKRYFRLILVISHTDGIKDAVDTMIEINKPEKDSRVFYE